MRIAQGTVTFLCKVKNHRGDPLNEATDDFADLGRTIWSRMDHTIDPEHAVWTTRSNRMVFSWIDGQKGTHVNMEPRGKERGAIGSWTIQI